MRKEKDTNNNRTCCHCFNEKMALELNSWPDLLLIVAVLDGSPLFVMHTCEMMRLFVFVISAQLLACVSEFVGLLEGSCGIAGFLECGGG